MCRLLARSVLVTGGSSGIGLAVARFLLGEGYGVTIVGRDPQRLRQAASGLAAGTELDRVHTVGADMGEDGAAESVIGAHLARFAGLDVVLANAGSSRRATVASTDPAHLRRLLAVHVESSFALARAALPALRRPADRAPSWFVLSASISAQWPVTGFAAYSAAKAALVSLARSLNAEEGRHGVRSCALCPAFVDTPLTTPLREQVRPEDMLRPDDLVAAMRFLLSLSPQATVSQLTVERVGGGPSTP